MAIESSDLKSFAALMLGLFVIMIVAAAVYIGADYLKETACEQNVADAHVWTNAQCEQSATNATVVTVKAVTQIGIIETVMDIVLGLLTLVVIVGIFKLVVRIAKGF